MDAALVKLMEGEFEALPGQTNEAGVQLEFLDSDHVQIVCGERLEMYTLKPLADLYGKGNFGTVDPQDQKFMPLFLGIEEEIAKYDSSKRRLTDAEISLALNEMSLNPEALSSNPLVEAIQARLRITLSLNNYSRQEIRQAIRRIGRSVERHNEGGRGRGYINFIQKFVGDKRRA